MQTNTIRRRREPLHDNLAVHYDLPGEGQAVSGVNRRAILRGALGAASASVLGRNHAAARAPGRIAAFPRRPLDFRPFADELGRFTAGRRGYLNALIPEKTVPRLQADLESGRYSTVDLVAYYVDRIRRIDALHFHSVIDLIP